ncbi:MAG: hypothetical protein ACHQFW_00035 [Chitinophagales bacterium]
MIGVTGMKIYTLQSLKKLAFTAFMMGSVLVYGQGTQIQFGQNRVQYKEFTWQFYEGEHFLVYFNQGGLNLGKFVAQIAEADLVQIEDLLDYKLNAKPELIVYNNISDYNQSNFAIGKEEQYNIGGQTKIIGNKVFIYFDGNHQHLRKQVREGIGKVLINAMIFGGNLQEIVQNAVLLNLPEWFTEGLISYIGEEWNTELDNQLREGVLTGRYKKFNKLTGEDARFAGHALWYYIAENYGEATIPNLLYLIRINRSLENGFLFVLGEGVNATIDDWYHYFLTKYEKESKDKTILTDENLIPRKTKKNVQYHNLVISPDGKNIAYAVDDHGKFKVYIQEIGSKDFDKVKRGGLKTHTLATDLSNPLLSWSPDGKKLAIVYEKRYKNFVTTYEVEKKDKETKELTRFQKILDMSFANTSNRLVMSVMNNGQSDIYMYYLVNDRVEQLTNDYFDDLHPAYVVLNNGYEGIIFASNRETDSLYTTRTIDSILPVGNMDLYFFDYLHKSKHIVKVTHSKKISEKDPVQFDGKHFAYLSDQNGIVNRFAGYLDSLYDHTDTLVYYPDSITTNPVYDYEDFTTFIKYDSVKLADIYRDTAYVFPVTNFASNIVEHDILWKTGKVVDVFQRGKDNIFYLTNAPDDLSLIKNNTLNNTTFRNFINLKKKDDDVITKISIKDTTTLITTETTITSTDTTKKEIDEGLYFQSDFPEPEITADNMDPVTLAQSDNPEQQNINTGKKFRSSRIIPYRIKFSSEYVTSQLDNSLFINKYESFNATGGVYSTPNLSALFTVSISDLFEDYRFTGGIRFPTSFSGGEYYLSYDDLKHRLDKKLIWYYQTQNAQYTFQPLWYPLVDAGIKTNIVEGTLKWPFDVIRSVRGSLAYRSEKIIFLANDTFSLNLPNYKEDWLTLKLEYVHDNTYPVMTNILNGLRYKVWFEVHKQFEVNADQGLKVSFNDGYLGVVGFDFRHYQKIHRQLTWANRIAGGTSFGPQKLIYYLGGVDSWIAPIFNQNIEIDQNAGYAFQTLATNLRGYEQNIRNGNSYAVFNSELRFPIFSYIFNKPIKTEFLRNLQIIGFYDIGSAWEGLSPFEEDNPYNNTVISQPPITVDVNYFRNPVVMGTGLGLRTTLFGYFVRVDRAQAIEQTGLADPMWYFSLSLDF